jgi:hypothetical protein
MSQTVSQTASQTASQTRKLSQISRARGAQIKPRARPAAADVQRIASLTTPGLTRLY